MGITSLIHLGKVFSWADALLSDLSLSFGSGVPPFVGWMYFS